MEKELSTAAAQTKRLLVDAAMDMTRIRGRMRWACRLVLVDGMKQSAAARKVGRDRRNVSRAIKALKPSLDKVHAEFERAVAG